jgi:hypothetical protein
MDLIFYHKILNKIRSDSEGKIILFRSVAIVLLSAMTVFMVYIAPIGLDKLFCVVLFVMFWYSKADYFWFAFFIIISSYPAGFFTETTFDAARRLPIFSPIPKVSFSLLDIFLILALLKAIIKGKRTKYWDVLRLKNIVYIFPFILIVSFFHGITLKIFLNAPVRGLFFYTLIYSFPALIHNKRELYKFMLMFFPFAFTELLSQIYYINAGTQLANLFNPGSLEGVYNSVTGDIRAVSNGFLLLRLVYVFAFILLYNKDYEVPKIYPLLIIISVLSSVLISATRTAIIMMLFIFIMYFVFVTKKKPNVLMQMFLVVVVLIMILDFTKMLDLNDIFGSSYKRFVGAVNVEEGNLKTEDTFDYRISVRLPMLMGYINNSLLIGYGFSDKYFQYNDGHLGGVPIGLLQAGVLGYIFYLIFIFNIFKKCFKYLRKIPENNTLHRCIKVYIISFFGYAIINFTVDPVFVLNTNTLPQDIFIHFIIASLIIYFALKEQAIKKLESKYEIAKLA